MALPNRVRKTGRIMSYAGTGTNDNETEAPTILVVEDEVLIRLAVSDYLRGCGYRVVEAGSGDEAVTVLTTDVRIDVVFTDVSMPGGLNGFGLAQWVLRQRPEVRVILTSGITRTAEEARDLCAHGPFMAKPYDHGELSRQIRALLTQR
jgi:CheY-like chemotaxis protein